MIRRPPRSTLDRSSAASDVYKRQEFGQRDIDSAAPLPREQRVVKGIYEVEQPEMVAVDNLDADGVLWLPGHQRHGVS